MGKHKELIVMFLVVVVGVIAGLTAANRLGFVKSVVGS